MSNGGKFWNPPPEGERPLRPELPVPPYVMIGEVECVLERVVIDDIPAWAERHSLERVRTAFMGRLGHVNIYWPRNGKEEEDDGEASTAGS